MSLLNFPTRLLVFLAVFKELIFMFGENWSFVHNMSDFPSLSFNFILWIFKKILYCKIKHIHYRTTQNN